MIDSSTIHTSLQLHSSNFILQKNHPNSYINNLKRILPNLLRLTKYTYKYIYASTHRTKTINAIFLWDKYVELEFVDQRVLYI